MCDTDALGATKRPTASTATHIAAVAATVRPALAHTPASRTPGTSRESARASTAAWIAAQIEVDYASPDSRSGVKMSVRFSARFSATIATAILTGCIGFFSA